MQDEVGSACIHLTHLQSCFTFLSFVQISTMLSVAPTFSKLHMHGVGGGVLGVTVAVGGTEVVEVAAVGVDSCSSGQLKKGVTRVTAYASPVQELPYLEV